MQEEARRGSGCNVNKKEANDLNNETERAWANPPRNPELPVEGFVARGREQGRRESGYKTAGMWPVSRS